MFWIVALGSAALVGHATLWLMLANHAEGTSLPWLMRRGVSCAAVAGFLGVPAWALRWLSHQGLNHWPALPAAAWFYLGLCWLVAVAVAYWLLVQNRQRGRARVLRSMRTERIDVRRSMTSADLGRGWPSWIARLPGNQVFHLELNELEIDAPRLPATLDGLRIVHLSDLHFAGRIGRAFFSTIVDRVNQMQPDIVAITGDLIDDERYLSWLPATLGQLQAPHGVFYVLGNHDLRVDLSRLRITLAEAGLTELGGGCRRVAIGRQHVLLAGNELPWIVPAADMTCSEARLPAQLRVLMSHSPDQYEWARGFDFDLMLAGHTHGGQIRLPLIGALVNPSRGPMEYAAGLFYVPPTILHVSRGVSGLFPLRWNCRPEITLLVLRAPTCAGSNATTLKPATAEWSI